jgi:hypothetical protein
MARVTTLATTPVVHILTRGHPLEGDPAGVPIVATAAAGGPAVVDRAP